MKQRFFRCNRCGNIIAKVKDSGVAVVCCGQNMEEIIPGTTDASQEKHLPVFKIDNNLVSVEVGESSHPMTSDHYIEWISIETREGNQRKLLTPDSLPRAEFKLTEGDELIAVYAYCNLHSLWKRENR